MQIPFNPEITTSTLRPLSDGVDGIKETLKNMVSMARIGKRTLAVRRLAGQLVNDIPQKSWTEEARAIQHFVRDHVRYTLDINDIETLQTPEKTIEFNYGDCDDKSVLAASLLESIGHPARFVAIGKEPGIFEHVLVETKIGDKWVSVETTEPVPLGWYPMSYKYRLTYNI